MKKRYNLSLANLNRIIFALAITIGTIFLAPKFVEGVAVVGHFDQRCSTKVWTPVSPDTQRVYCNQFNRYAILTENFNNPPSIGDSIYIKGGWDLGNDTRVLWILKASSNYVPDLHLGRFTADIREVIDTSNVSANLNGIFWITGYAPETTFVDTGYTSYWYYDIHAPFDTLQATQGAEGNIRLEKVIADTTWLTEIQFTVDRSKFDAQLIMDTIWFPYEKIIVGIDESKSEEVGLFTIFPTIGNRFIISGTSGFAVYDVSGKKVREYMNCREKTYEFNLPSGVYFVRPQENNNRIKKVLIVR